jgi:hypothetical protein
MEYTLSMVFNTEYDQKITFSITKVKPDITEAEANALMDTIVTNDVFLLNSGGIKSKVSSQLVAKNVTKFEVA